jgi:hypothetical protein
MKADETLDEVVKKLTEAGYDPVDELREMMLRTTINPELVGVLSHPTAAFVVGALVQFAQDNIGVGVSRENVTVFKDGTAIVDIDMADLFEQFMVNYISKMMEMVEKSHAH